MALYNIKVKGTDRSIEIDSDRINDDLAAYIFQKGLDSIMGRGRAKLGKPEEFHSKAHFEAEAYAIAEAQRADLYSGKTRMVGGTKKAKGADAAVQTEMLRLAKLDGKAMVRAQGTVKVSRVSAAEWTKLGKTLIERDPDKYRKAAEANLAAAASTFTKPEEAGIDLSFIKEDEKKVAAAKKSAADKKAAKEGKVAAPPPAKAKPSKQAPARQ